MNWMDYIDETLVAMVEYVDENLIDIYADFEDVDEILDAWYGEDYISMSNDISGNLNGSYTFSRTEAKNNLIGDVLISEEFWDFVYEFDLTKSIADFLVAQDYEAVDVIVRMAAIQANESDLKRYILREVSKKKH